MTIDDLKNGSYAIYVDDYDDFTTGMKLLESLGFTWLNGKKFSEETLTRNTRTWHCFYTNENGVTRYSTNGSYYVIVNGCYLSKRVRSYINNSGLISININNLATKLNLDVDEDGFEKEIL